MTIHDFINKIDFKQLKAQKLLLIHMQSKLNNSDSDRETLNAAIEGILSLMDYIQDTASEHTGKDDDEIYIGTDEDTGEVKLTYEQAATIVLFPGSQDTKI